MSGKITGLYICCPDGGQVMQSKTVISIFNTASVFWWKYQVPSAIVCRNCSDLEELRNYLVSEFYYKHLEFSHMLCVDNDMGFDWRMVQDMVAFDKPLIGAMYSRRCMPPSVVAQPLKDDTIEDVVDGHLEVAKVGFGVVLLKRECIDEMIRQHPEWRTEPRGLFKERLEHEGIPYLLRLFDKVRFDGGGGLSEDFSFCYRWREMCAGKVWANVNYPVIHIGSFDYTIRYADYLEKSKVEAMPYWQRMDVGGEAAA